MNRIKSSTVFAFVPFLSIADTSSTSSRESTPIISDTVDPQLFSVFALLNAPEKSLNAAYIACPKTIEPP
jgi:hypothetical protein